MADDDYDDYRDQEPNDEYSDNLYKMESRQFSEPLDRNAMYQIRPSLANKFKSNAVKEVINSVLYEELEGKTYSVEESEEWTKTIVKEVKDSVKNLGFKRYKIIVQIILGQNKGSGVKIGARCLWDADTDNYASDYFINDTMFCCVAVFGIYCY